MEKTKGKIIKSQDVQCDGQYYLNMEQANHNSSQKNGVVAGAPMAHIIENKNEGVVIKVTCSCGQEIALQCEYENNNK
jgi:hypothetical protein